MCEKTGTHTFTFNVIDGVVDETNDCHYGGWEQKGEEIQSKEPFRYESLEVSCDREGYVCTREEKRHVNFRALQFTLGLMHLCACACHPLKQRTVPSTASPVIGLEKQPDFFFFFKKKTKTLTSMDRLICEVNFQPLSK